MVQAVILCAGSGNRLGELTKCTPKPMIKFNNLPFLRYVIAYYKKEDILDFIIPVGYFAETITSYFKSGKQLGVKINYAQSSVEVESGGSFKKCLPFVKDDYFFVQFGDVFFPLDYKSILNKLIKSGKKALVIASVRDRPLKDYEDKNDLIVDEKGFVLGYDRCNTSGKANMLNGGVFIFRKDVIKQNFPDVFKLEEVLFSKLISEKELITFITHKIPYDIGNVEKMKRFKEYTLMINKKGKGSR